MNAKLSRMVSLVVADLLATPAEHYTPAALEKIQELRRAFKDEPMSPTAEESMDAIVEAERYFPSVLLH